LQAHSPFNESQPHVADAGQVLCVMGLCVLASATRTASAGEAPAMATVCNPDVRGAGLPAVKEGVPGAVVPATMSVASSSSPPSSAETTGTLDPGDGAPSFVNPLSSYLTFGVGAPVKPLGRLPESTRKALSLPGTPSLVRTARLYGGANDAVPNTEGSVAWPVTRPCA